MRRSKPFGDFSALERTVTYASEMGFAGNKVSSIAQNLHTASRSAQTEALLHLLDAHRDEMPSNLHIHSTVSDGSHGFAQILEKASTQDYLYVAFTNHDTTARLDEAILLGSEFDIGVLGGVEISAWDKKNNCKAHILGYGLFEDSQAVETLCAPTRKARNDQSMKALKAIEDAGYDIDSDLALSLARESGVLYKQHIMAAMTKAPFSSNEYQSLYKELFKGDGIAAGDIEYVDACDAVHAIVADGGVAVLAHPGQYGNYDLVPDLVDCGLRGIERRHPLHSEKDMEHCEQIAEKYGLFCTGGTDYHGRFGAPSL